MKFSIKDFFSKCDQIRNFLQLHFLCSETKLVLFLLKLLIIELIICDFVNFCYIYYALCF